MSKLFLKLKICYILIASPHSIAKTLHKLTNGSVMDHYNVKDNALLEKMLKSRNKI